MKIIKEKITQKITEEVTCFCDICGEKIDIEKHQINYCEICGREHCNCCHNSSHISNLQNHHDKKILIGICSIYKRSDIYHIEEMDKRRVELIIDIDNIKSSWKTISRNKLSPFEKQKSEEKISDQKLYDKLFKRNEINIEEYEETKDKEYEEYEEKINEVK